MTGDRLANFERRSPKSPKIQTRRKKKYLTFDLRRVYHDAINRLDDFRLIDDDQRLVMEILVDGYVQSTLQSFVKKTVHETGKLSEPTYTNTEFVNALTNKHPTLASAAQISGLSIILRSTKDQVAHYAEREIAEYMCGAFNDAMHEYGVYARIEDGDVVLHKVRNFTRAEARELVESIET